MTQRQFGTLRYIVKRGVVTVEELRKIHAGTLQSLLNSSPPYLACYREKGEPFVSLTEEGEKRFYEFVHAGYSARKHESDLTANTMRLLKLAKLKDNVHVIRKHVA